MSIYSIIIPAYNEEENLPLALASVKIAMASVDVPGEVIVVDNNSTDRTAAIAREAGAQVVFEAKNQISLARNAGAKAAHGRFLIFLDADTLLSPGLLSTAVRHLQTGLCCGGGAKIILRRESGPVWVHWAARIFIRALMLVRIVGGSFIYCLKEAYDDIGGFNEKVYAAEDAIFSHDLRRWGNKAGKEFIIITDFCIESSDRKLGWFSPMTLAFTFLLFAVFPFAVYFRPLCGLWYKRPSR